MKRSAAEAIVQFYCGNSLSELEGNARFFDYLYCLDGQYFARFAIMTTCERRSTKEVLIGETYDVRETLKGYGFTWDASIRGFTREYENHLEMEMPGERVSVFQAWDEYTDIALAEITLAPDGKRYFWYESFFSVLSCSANLSSSEKGELQYLSSARLDPSPEQHQRKHALVKKALDVTPGSEFADSD